MCRAQMSQRAVWPIPRIQTNLPHSTTSRSNWPTRIHRRPCSTPSQVRCRGPAATRSGPQGANPLRERRGRDVVIGAVTSAMLVAANVQDAAGRDALAAGVADSSALVPELPVAEPAAAVPAPAVLPAPAPQSIPVATPVAQPPPAPPLPAPTVQKRAPVVQVRQPVPSRVIAEPTPVAVEKPLPAAPIAVEPEPVEALPIPAPAVAPPPPIFTPPSPPALSAAADLPRSGCLPRRSDPACRVVAVDPAVAEDSGHHHPNSEPHNLSHPAPPNGPQHPMATATRRFAYYLWPRQQAPQPQLDAPSSAVDACANPAEDAVPTPAADAIPCPTVDSGAGDSSMEAGPVGATAADSGDVSFAVPVPVAVWAIHSVRHLSIATGRARTNSGRILGPALSVWGCPADRKPFPFWKWNLASP